MEPRPDLGGIGAHQPFSYDGERDHGRTVEPLMKMVDGYCPGRLQQKLQRSQQEELREAERVSGNETTDDGQLLVAVMDEAEASSMTAIETQMNGSSAVPGDTDDVFQDAWREKWMLWSLEGSCSAGDLEPLTYLTAGRRGQHRLAQ